jgi:ABC-type sugar transport system substrate-binding protein
MKSGTAPARTFPLAETLCLLLLFVGMAATAEPMFKVGFVAPADRNDPFFSQVVDMMRAAADDLNIELKVDYSGRGVSLYAKRAGLKLISTYKPDYFLTGYWPGGAKYHLKEAEEQRIKSFVFNSPVIAEDDFQAREPRKALRYWIGQMTPDYRQAGYQLADILIEAAAAQGLRGEDGKVHMIALSGNADDISATQRVNGLQDRIRKKKDAVLRQVVLAGWSKEIAERSTTELLAAYPEVSVIWTASDYMALGAAAAAERAGRKPGKDIVIGGFDWNEANLRDIKTGRITASVGGHIFEGALALILLYDYDKGIDFADELGVEFHSPMYAVTGKNIDQYQRMLQRIDWNDIDFTKFSKALNPGLKRYDFPSLFNTLLATPAPADDK